jgi:hypothetical protein
MGEDQDWWENVGDGEIWLQWGMNGLLMLTEMGVSTT